MRLVFGVEVGYATGVMEEKDKILELGSPIMGQVVRIPNEETLQAIRDVDERRDLLTHESLEDFMRSLEV